MAFSIAALTFLGWWQNTLAVEYAGPLVWNLIMAGLFWVAASATVMEAVRLVREGLRRLVGPSELR